MPNAIALLKADHKAVKELLTQLEDTTERASKTRERLLERIGKELRVHAQIEEEIFYPALRDATEELEPKRLVAEAKEEHRAVEKLVLPDLEATDVNTVEFSGRAKVLKELVEHHADEEEEEMFEQARKVLSKTDLEQLGEKMAVRKQELMAGE